MMINTKNMVSITEANQNFSRVARMVEEDGAVIILKNNRPVYKITYIPQEEPAMSEEDIMAISDQLMERFGKAYQGLAQ